VPFDDRIVDLAAGKYLGQRMTDEFADAQLARRSGCGLIASLAGLVTWHFLQAIIFVVMPGFMPGIHVFKSRCDRGVDSRNNPAMTL
jgi:hypothetical protein